jgi:hypothetical protein
MKILFLFFMFWIQTTFGYLSRPYFFCAKVKCQSLFAWSFSRFWVLKFLKAHVCMCLLKVLSTIVFQSFYLPMFELLSTSVSQSSWLHVFVSKFLSTNYVSQNSSLFASPMYVSKSTNVYLHEFWKELMSFEAHHKHGLLYHIVFARVYQRLWIFKLLKAHLLCATIYLHEIWKHSNS